MSLTRRQVARLLAATLAPALGADARAAAASAPPALDRGQTLRLIVPFAAGGGVDSAARLLADQLRRQHGATVIVENKAGASGTLGGQAVRTAPPDGSTLLFSAATHVMARHVLAAAPYDPQTDFTPVARVGEAPLMLVVPPTAAQKTLAETLAAIRRQPEGWTAAIPAAGAPSHLATLRLARQAGLNLSYVPYKGTQPAAMDVAGGHVQLLMDSMISLLPLAKGGKLRPLAVTSKARSPLAPDVPTMAEAGAPGFTFESWYGVWAPKGTPADRIAGLNAAINAAGAELAKSGAWAALGISPVSETPEQFRQQIAAEVAEGVELLRAAGFRPE